MLGNPSIGTRVFFVPIRYWESKNPIETGVITERCGGEHVYAHHDGYGHGVYMPRARTFKSRKDARAAMADMSLKYHAQRRAEFDAWWEANKETIFANAAE